MYHRNRPDSSPRRTNAHPANAGTPQEDNRQENQATQAHAGLPALARAASPTELRAGSPTGDMPIAASLPYMLSPGLENRDIMQTNIAASGIIEEDASLAFSFHDFTIHGNELEGSDTEGIDFSNAKFENCNLKGCSFKNANMRGAFFYFSRLQGCNFNNANLSGVEFSNCNINGASFNNSNMQNVIFSNNFYDDKTDFSNANLSGAVILSDEVQYLLVTNVSLDGVCIDDIDHTSGLVNVILERGTPSRLSLKLPRGWNEWAQDRYLNHHNNDTSIPKVISDIDDRHANIKVMLMVDLIKSLRDKDVDLSAPSFPQFPLMEALMSSSVFSENETLRPFIDELYNVFNWSNILNYSVAPQVYTALLKYALNNSGSEQPFFQRNNAVFTLLALKIMASDSASDVQNIYESYLKHPAITPLVEMNTDFGDFNGKPDWDDQNATNFLLLSGGDMSSVMHISYSALTDMLNNGGKVSGWENYYLFKDRENIALASVNKKTCSVRSFQYLKMPMRLL